MTGLYMYCWIVGVLGAVASVFVLIPLWVSYEPGKHRIPIAQTIALLLVGAGLAFMAGLASEHLPQDLRPKAEDVRP